jgi:signal transduction histidine kinase
MLVALAFAVFLLLCIIAVVLVRLRHRKSAKEGEKNDLDTLRDQLSILRLQYSDAQRAMVEQRARGSIISGMLSLIERLRHAVSRKDNDYAREITRDIEQQNAMLTQWIKLNQGKISPKIETFPISDILSIVEQSRQNLAAQGITLNVEETNPKSPFKGDLEGLLVRADKSLTLFIINTLIDNARKAITGKGKITITLTPQPVTGR